MAFLSLSVFLFSPPFLLWKAACSVFVQPATGSHKAFVIFFPFLTIRFLFFRHLDVFILCCVPSVTPSISRAEIVEITSGSKSVGGF